MDGPNLLNPPAPNLLSGSLHASDYLPSTAERVEWQMPETAQPEGDKLPDGYRRAHDSTCIANSSYDKKSQRLTLTFARDDTTYEYSNVPRSQYLNLMDAPSKGRLFNSDIRPAYPYAKRR